MTGFLKSLFIPLLLMLLPLLSGGAFTNSDDAGLLSDTKKMTILFLGNSLSAGYGVEPEQAFPALVGGMIDSLGWQIKVINGGLSGETSSGGLRRINWLLRSPVDMLVLELGGNDGLRGIPVEVTRKNLQGIIDRVREHNPQAHIVLAGMQVPPNMGEDYAVAFRRIYPELAKENEATLIPFLLEGVGGVPDLNQSDQIHPTAEGHRIVAKTVWQYLKPLLQGLLEETTFRTRNDE